MGGKTVFGVSKRSLFLYILYMILIFFCIKSVFSATIFGTVYNWELDKETKAVVEVDSNPLQRMAAVNGTYSFELKKGNYVISAKIFNQEEYSANENITVLDDDGRYNLDLFLFYEMNDYVNDEDIDFSLSENKNYNIYYAIGVAVAIVLAILIILFYNNYKKKKNKTPFEEDKKDALDDKIKFDIIKILKEKGGADTQKNIRKNFDYSEAKISLIIKSLVSDGKVIKEKRGTINYLKLK